MFLDVVVLEIFGEVVDRVNYYFLLTVCKTVFPKTNKRQNFVTCQVIFFPTLTISVSASFVRCITQVNVYVSSGVIKYCDKWLEGCSWNCKYTCNKSKVAEYFALSNFVSSCSRIGIGYWCCVVNRFTGRRSTVKRKFYPGFGKINGADVHSDVVIFHAIPLLTIYLTKCAINSRLSCQ